MERWQGQQKQRQGMIHAQQANRPEEEEEEGRRGAPISAVYVARQCMCFQSRMRSVLKD